MKLAQCLSAFALSAVLASPAIAKPRPKPEPVKVEDVVLKIKEQLRQYDAYVAAHPAAGGARCDADAELKVSGATISMVTVTGKTSSAEASAEIPIGPITLSGGGSGSLATKNTQTLTFTLLPIADRAVVTPWKEGDTLEGFAAVLANLRTSFHKTSQQEPCFGFGPEKDQKNKVEFGFTVTRDRGSSLGISFLFFKLGGKKKGSDEATNTVTIAFTGSGAAILSPDS
ncbi:hypothetical protein [uncultured Sphingorhabdus sp.]|uniref:hypothetical protein n=1 Tax=uncultured Sphingorhabdus sp. TaxID=1686106 RepID=UPI00261F0B40|nr:hypothetical protein [uncultured Sphingorhabdus sp.]HMS21457.1 hypothetical protein [Sphingorhabdus sp.]